MRVLVLILLCLHLQNTISQNFERQLYLRSDSSINHSREPELISAKNHDELNALMANSISKSSWFLTKQSDSIVVNITLNDVIYYLEYDSQNRIKCFGALGIDRNSFILDSTTCLIKNTTDNEFSVDTSYLLVPKGEWTFNLDSIHWVHMHFSEGKKHGVSQVRIHEAGVQNIISEEIYLEGILLKTKSGKNVTMHELEQLIEGLWHHYMRFDSCGNYNLFAYRKEIRNDYPGLQTSNFLVDGSYLGTRTFLCGVGIQPEDKTIIGLWSLNQDGTITFGEMKFKISYIDEEIMVLKKP